MDKEVSESRETTNPLLPSNCTVLIIDKRFLKGVYHTSDNNKGAIRAGPARDDVVFVQELLEIYSQVVAVLSGDTALRWIFGHMGRRTIIALIDVDDTRDVMNTGNGPIYTPPASPAEDSDDIKDSKGSEHEPGPSGPYGLALLRIIAHYSAIGVFRNVAPIAMSTSRDPAFMRQAASMGALNYLIKPVSAQTVHSLWLNVSSYQLSSTAGKSSSSKSRKRDSIEMSRTTGTHGPSVTTTSTAAMSRLKQRRGSEGSASVAGMTNGGATAVTIESAHDPITASPRQAIFQRRIRTDTINGASTAGARNSVFEEDFIRQFVPSIGATLPAPNSGSRSNINHTAADKTNGTVSPATLSNGTVMYGDELDSDNEGLGDYDDDSYYGQSASEFATSEYAEKLRARLLEWSFCPYDMQHSEMADCAVLMILDAAVSAGLELRLGRVRRFVTILESAYYDNPYHNFHHAIDVTQCTFYVLYTLGMFSEARCRRSSLRSPGEVRRFPVRRILRPSDCLALIVASLCHDLGHPGLNNAFMVRAQTQLAEIYNDQSVLENFHAACFSMIMSHYFTDFVVRSSMPIGGCGGPGFFDYEEFRRIAVHGILATDMARHFEFISKCKSQQERFCSGFNLPLTEQQHETERSQLCASILKCADISNIVRPFSVAQRWTRRLNRELTLQGDIEESLGMTRSAVVNPNTIPESQIGFYKTCGRPLFRAVAELIPELQFMADQLENNIRNWGYVMANQKAPQVPYGVRGASAIDLFLDGGGAAITGRAGSTDSAPEVVFPKRSNTTIASSVYYTNSTTTVANDTIENYSLHVPGQNKMLVDGIARGAGPLIDGVSSDMLRTEHKLVPSAAVGTLDTLK